MKIPNQADLSEQVSWVRKCMKWKNLITVFSVNRADENRDLDNAILRAILNGVLTLLLQI